MRLIKMFGFAVIATVAATAFAGASSAMAENTSLCKEDVALATACPAGKLALHVHLKTQKLSGGVLVPAKLKVLTPLLTVECVGLFLGDVTNATLLGAPLTILGNFSYSSCTAGCSITEVSSDGVLSALREGGGELAKVTGTGFKVLVTCGLTTLHCVYDWQGLVGDGFGALVAGHTGAVIYNEAVLHSNGEGMLCPPEAKLDANFLPLEGEALYIRS
jgi:hypothetical protein